MKLQYFKPAPGLSDIIKYYWVLEMEAGESPQEQQFFPLGAIEIIFHLGVPFLRSGSDGWMPEKNAFIEGQQTGILKVRQDGPVKTLGITLYPWATCLLYKTSPGIFTNNNFSISDVDISFNELYESLLMVSNDDELSSACDKFLISFIKRKYFRYTESDRYVIDLFKKSSDYECVSDLKTRWNYSSRFFEKKFVELIGVSAGELMKKKRMNKAIRYLLSDTSRTLTDVAHASGYYDQSHFTKDFRFYFQMKPSQLLKQNESLLKHFT